MQNSELIARFIKERYTKTKTVYSEYEPTWIVGGLYLNTHSLRQTFGHVPEKLQIAITEVQLEAIENKSPEDIRD